MSGPGYSGEEKKTFEINIDTGEIGGQGMSGWTTALTEPGYSGENVEKSLNFVF